jgi:hypothetical protein
MAQLSPSNSTMGHCQQQEMRWKHSWLGPLSWLPRRYIALFCLRKHFPLKTLDEFAKIFVVFSGPILLESSAPWFSSLFMLDVTFQGDWHLMKLYWCVLCIPKAWLQLSCCIRAWDAGAILTAYVSLSVPSYWSCILTMPFSCHCHHVKNCLM